MRRRGRSPCNRKRKTPQRRRKHKTKPAQLCVKRYRRPKFKADQVACYQQKRKVTKRRVRKRAAPRSPEIYVLYCKQRPPKKSIFSNLKC